MSAIVRLARHPGLIALRLHANAWKDKKLVESTVGTDKTLKGSSTLKYLVLSGEMFSDSFAMVRDSSQTTVDGHTTFRIAPIAPLRSFPLRGKWSVDWTDESVLDHFS